ncbi:HAD family hydrolase [Catenulispora pinisilvae]|uniref:HAD family hydrolase n=1 Tax=Catenulispora pinisilvae TaxID=2705253 RepID=UPI001890D03D|nr:HAD family hydrolase [Catenulispora pinisilvae]
MTFEAVVFDLFGTLVPPFRKAEHTEAIRGCARVLGMDFEACHALWIESFGQRTSGGFASVADNFAWMGDRTGVRLDPQACRAAAVQYGEFTRAGLEPLEGVERTLAALKTAGLRLGLLTNCAPDVPSILAETAWGSRFDAAVFSCTARVSKPEPRSYELVLDRLGIPAGAVLYVGDGSDGELRGAAAAGLHPVLVTPDLTNTYDRTRPDVESWTGPRIATIPDVLGYLDGR